MICQDIEERRFHCHRALSLGRFVIRPDGRCKKLASRVLGLCMRCLGHAFTARKSHVSLLVETVVNSGLHDGRSQAAANWTLVSETADWECFALPEESEPMEDVWLYPLRADWCLVGWG